MSFLFGLTAVEFWPYLGASAIGILPASFVYVYMGRELALFPIEHFQAYLCGA